MLVNIQSTKCDLIKKGLGELLLNDDSDLDKHSLRDMILNTIKLKHIIENEREF